MLLIAGLGNPGEEYAKTRHNVGFMFMDDIKSELEKSNGLLNWSLDEKFEAEHLNVAIRAKGDGSGNDAIHLLKPLTFMNRSGSSLLKLLNWYKVGTEIDIIVAYDDLDLELGEYKIQKDVTPKSHNGVNSVVSSIGKDFLSVRLGVDSRKGDRTIPGSDYVLKRMDEDELVLIKRAINSAIIDVKSQYKEYFVS